MKPRALGRRVSCRTHHRALHWSGD
jgi:hypothetical protein